LNNPSKSTRRRVVVQDWMSLSYQFSQLAPPIA
jgi:hypothetical protein